MTGRTLGARYHRWTAEENALVLAQTGLDRDLASQLGVSVVKIQSHRSALRKKLGPDAPPGRIDDPRVSRVGTMKTCPVCGAQFRAKPTGRRTCSDQCARYRSGSSRRGKFVPWSEDAKRRRSELGQTANLRLGALAVPLSPLTGPFETNLKAKTWFIANLESGQRWPEVRNLGKWCRDHETLFAPDDWQRAYAGLRMVQRWLTGKTKERRSRWKNWSLYREAVVPKHEPE